MMRRTISCVKFLTLLGPVREDWFFGQKAVPLLSRWRERSIEMPGIYLSSYLVFWVIWVVAYSATMHWHGVDPGVAHTSPHIAFSAIITGAILFPRQAWWLPMTAFTLLFALSLLGPEMHYLTHSQDGVALGVMAFVLNLVIGLTAVRGVVPAVERFVKTYTRLSVDVAVMAVLFALLPLSALLIHLLQWGIFLIVATTENTLAEFSVEMLMHVLHRGVRGGIVTIAIVFLFIRLPRKYEIVLLSLSLPFVAASVWGTVGLELSQFELVLATILLVHAVIMPFMATVLLILCVLWPLSAASSAFMRPWIDGLPHQAVAQIVTSALAVIVVLVLLAKLQNELVTERRGTHSRNLRRLQGLLGSGRFALDAGKGMVYLDSSAQALLNLKEECHAQAFLQGFDEESVTRFLEVVNNAAPAGVALRMSRNLTAISGEPLEMTLRVCVVVDENTSETREFFYGLIEDISAFE